MTFIPFDASDSEIEELSVLRTEISSGLQNELIVWAVDHTQDGTWVRTDIFRQVANALDLNLAFRSTVIARFDAMAALGALPGRDLLHVVDYMLSRGYPIGVVPAALDRARSAYTVRPDGVRNNRLTQRVPEALLSAARDVTSRNDAAGRLLTQAWNKAFDLEPDDSAAYMHAVQAVEAAGISALGIDNPEATLGSVIRTIEKDASWSLPFLREHAAASTNGTLLYMLKSLWRGHRDRHGSAAWEGVTHDETVAALYLALSLVSLFQTGLVRRRHDSPADL